MIMGFSREGLDNLGDVTMAPVQPFRKRSPESQLEHDQFQEAEGRFALGLPYGLAREPDAKGRGSCPYPDRISVPVGDPADGVSRIVTLACDRCKACYIRKIYAKCVLIMRELATCDHSCMMSLTIANPAPVPDDGDVLSTMPRAFRLSLPSRMREDWRPVALDRFLKEHAQQRASREYDLAHEVCLPEQLRDMIDKLRSDGRQQGMVPVLDAQGRPMYQEIRRRKPGLALRDEAGKVLRDDQGRVLRGPERVVAQRKLIKVFDPSRGYKLRIFAAYERSDAGRSHWHLIVGIIGARPDGWRDLAGQDDQRQWIRQWPHGHVHIGWDVGEKSARYACKYMLKQMAIAKGKPRGRFFNTDRAAAYAQYDLQGNLDLKATAAIRDQADRFGIMPGCYRQPQKAGHAFAYGEGVRHAAFGLPPVVDAILATPGMRNQTDEWQIKDGKRVRVHKGRAVPAAGSCRTAYLEGYLDGAGLPQNAVTSLYDRRDGRFAMHQSLVRADKAFADRADRLARRERIAAGKAVAAPPRDPPSVRFARSRWGQVPPKLDPENPGLDGLAVLVSIFESEQAIASMPDDLDGILDAAMSDLDALTASLASKYAPRRRVLPAPGAARDGEAFRPVQWDGARFQAVQRPEESEGQSVPWFQKPGSGWWSESPDFRAVSWGLWMQWPQGPP